MSDKNAFTNQRALTPSLQHYLEFIYRAEQEQGAAHASAVADAAGVSRATVTSTLKTLHSLGLVEYERYSPIRLTEEGRRIGRDLMHRHIVCREFFQNILQFDEAQAAAVASELEHIVPRHVIRRWGQFVAYMQKREADWKDWQNEYADSLRAFDTVSKALGAKAGLDADETAELMKKYR